MARRPLIEPNPDKLNEVKMEVCLALRRVAMREGWSQHKMALYCGASPSRMGKAVRLQVDDLTVGQVFNYLASLYPRFRIQVST